MFSYFPYAAAFVRSPDGEARVDPGLVGISLVLAPLVFIVVALVSKNPRAPRMVLTSMGLLLVLGLALGLVSPVLGAAAGFGVGAALCLRLPDIPDQLRRRIIAVALALAYTTILLVVATPAGVLTGAIVPMLMVGIADEYGAWRFSGDNPARIR
ncbi:MAG: hypothetical protein M3P87_03010 [Actinomycetota bacterium]|nr:hypothetical protein [Actinomycetota bacterium]